MPKMTLLPPAPDSCPECGASHEPELPHDPASLYWQTKRRLEGLPTGTWEDAMAHCSEEVKEAWGRILKEQYGFGCPECGGWKKDKNDYVCDSCRTDMDDPE